MQGYGSVFLLLAMIPMNHALLRSLQAVDYRDRWYVWTGGILTGSIDLFFAFAMVFMRTGNGLPYNIDWYVGGLTCASAVFMYCMNAKFRARRKKEKEQ